MLGINFLILPKSIAMIIWPIGPAREKSALWAGFSNIVTKLSKLLVSYVCIFYVIFPHLLEM